MSSSCEPNIGQALATHSLFATAQTKYFDHVMSVTRRAPTEKHPHDGQRQQEQEEE